MFALSRRFDICSIGLYVHARGGRPNKRSTESETAEDDDEMRWVQKCNFVFKTLACVSKWQEVENNSDKQQRRQKRSGDDEYGHGHGHGSVAGSTACEAEERGGAGWWVRVFTEKLIPP